MIVHPQTAEEYKNLVMRPPHALLIAGEEGAGKPTIATEFVKAILQKNVLEADSTYRRLSPIKDSIGIEQIRELQKFLHLKTMGGLEIRRAALIEDAHTMTHEAQNALLKILEEPPADTVIVLTAIPSNNILPTIYSRVQQLSLRTPSLEHITAQLKQYKSMDIEHAYGLSNGLMGLLIALLEQSDEHALVESILRAKSVLAMTKFERLALVDQLSKQKAAVPGLLQALKRIARSAMAQAAKNDREAQVSNWHTVLVSVQETESLLVHNPNTKLLLTNLMLKI
jgi:DNA polymerase III subunit delta'